MRPAQGVQKNNIDQSLQITRSQKREVPTKQTKYITSGHLYKVADVFTNHDNSN